MTFKLDRVPHFVIEDVYALRDIAALELGQNSAGQKSSYRLRFS